MTSETASLPSHAQDALAEAQRVLDSAPPIFSKHQIEAAMDRLAGRLSTRLTGTNPLILCVMQGGLMFTAGMMQRMKLMTELDYIHASRYGGNTSGDALRWLAYPTSTLKDRVVLILDDIFDKGHTLAAIESYCRQQGARDVVSAVLLYKRCQQQTGETSCEFAALEVDDRYVFGYGMDYRGQFRYLDHIRALPQVSNECGETKSPSGGSSTG